METLKDTGEVILTGTGSLTVGAKTFHFGPDVDREKAKEWIESQMVCGVGVKKEKRDRMDLLMVLIIGLITIAGALGIHYENYELIMFSCMLASAFCYLLKD